MGLREGEEKRESEEEEQREGLLSYGGEEWWWREERESIVVRVGLSFEVLREKERNLQNNVVDILFYCDVYIILLY